MIHLPNVTLLQIDTIDYDRAKRAETKCLEHFTFAESKILQPESVKSYEDYNRYVVRDLWKHFKTDFVLLYQWDGYIQNPDAWQDEFLQCDYIGAPWWYDDDIGNVGNGGFSIRSKKFCEVSELVGQNIEYYDNGIYAPEDKVLCRGYRSFMERYGIRFAPVELAEKFSWEWNVEYPTYNNQFGIHGDFSIAKL